MDGMLSQDEINSLLSGMGTDDAASTDSPASEATDPSGGGILSDIERDAVGEVANISMGTSATTLYSLVNRKVDITTPEVTVATWDTLIKDYERPCVFVQIHYKVGLDGSNILVLRENDVKVITDLMMGGDGTNTDGELGELHLSAISEAMNQMMGSAATSLSTMLGKMIDISPPEASLVDLNEFGKPEDIASFLGGQFVKVSFRMIIEDLVNSSIMQLYPIDFAKELCQHFMGDGGGDNASSSQEAASTPPPPPSPAPDMGMQPQMQQPMPQMMPQQDMGMGMGMQPQMMPQMPYGMPQMAYGPMPQQNVNVQPATFGSFSGAINPMQPQENIDLIKDVPLEVTVELGRTHKSINEILDFAPGTIIELDKIAGEPIDILVNGKYVAKGEVVVIEESFGVRITEIIK